MRFFLEARGIIPGLVNSVVVALITLALSTLIAAPAGYALSRILAEDQVSAGVHQALVEVLGLE